MMKKYRVNEVAKDLNVENKDVIEALKPFSDEPKKYMTALTEEDLDVVFDTFTKENSVESFDAYFAEREDAQPTSSSKEAPESKENTTAKVQEKAVVEKEKTAVKPAVKESKSNAANKNNKQTKPAAQKQEKTMQDKGHRCKHSCYNFRCSTKTCRKNCRYTYFPSEYGPLQRKV